MSRINQHCELLANVFIYRMKFIKLILAIKAQEKKEEKKAFYRATISRHHKTIADLSVNMRFNLLTSEWKTLSSVIKNLKLLNWKFIKSDTTWKENLSTVQQIVNAKFCKIYRRVWIFVWYTSYWENSWYIFFFFIPLQESCT